MPASSDSPDEPRWLVEPPDSGEVRLQIATGEKVKLSDEVRLALERLLESFQTQDVGGYAKCFPRCADLTACGTFACNGLNNCSVLVRYPCAMELRCAIKKT
jgi:hypothetical protein